LSEIGLSIAEAIRKRTLSAALGTYTFFWLAVHWQGVYATLFVNQSYIFDKFHMLKNEYVSRYFFGYQGPWLAAWYYLAPFVLTIAYIWGVQRYLLIVAYTEEQKSRTARKKVRLKEELEIAEFEKKNAQIQTAALDAQIELSQKAEEAANQDPEIVWKNQYDQFRKLASSISVLQDIMNAVYQNQGSITDDDGALLIDPRRQAIADSNGLVTIHGDQITLTDKGKFFMRLFTSGQG
jgi:hypothetical protein